MISDVRQAPTSPAGGDPIGPGLLSTLRRVWESKSGRRALLALLAVVVVVMIVVVGIVVLSSGSHEPQSFRDGYSVGGAVYASDNAEVAPKPACEETSHRGPTHGGPPAGDDVAEWVKGCVDGFNAAQGGN